MVADSNHFDEVQDPDPLHIKKLDPGTYQSEKSVPNPYQNEKRDPDPDA